MSPCDQARDHLRAIARGLGAVPDDVRAHVAGCATCTAALADERALDRALDALPRTPAPAALRAKLAAIAPARVRRSRWWIAIPPLVAAAAVLLIALVVARGAGPDPLVREAVDDHLRLVYGEHPLDVAASDMHAVKPWFTGRLDFAPVLPFVGDDQFTLVGGAVGVYQGRKCAVIAWRRRLHAITLIVVPAAGLDFPTTPRAGRERGFATLMWQRGDLGYALVSDVDPADLAALASKLAPAGDSR